MQTNIRNRIQQNICFVNQNFMQLATSPMFWNVSKAIPKYIKDLPILFLSSSLKVMNTLYCDQYMYVHGIVG